MSLSQDNQKKLEIFSNIVILFSSLLAFWESTSSSFGLINAERLISSYTSTDSNGTLIHNSEDIYPKVRKEMFIITFIGIFSSLFIAVIIYNKYSSLANSKIEKSKKKQEKVKKQELKKKIAEEEIEKEEEDEEEFLGFTTEGSGGGSRFKV